MSSPQQPVPITGPDGPRTDQVPLAARGLALALLIGTAAVALVLLAVRLLVRQAPPTDSPDPFQPAGLVLLFGTLGSCGLAAVITWVRLAPVTAYRRGSLAMVAGFATFVAALLMPFAHEWLGLAGLGGAAALCLVLAALLGLGGRRAT